MEFWGIEVKPGVPVKVQPGAGAVLCLSNACLGEVKKTKGSHRAHIFLTVNDQKLVIGTISHEKPQISYEMKITEDFELSHDWKNGSIYFTGYKSLMSDGSYEDHTDCDHDAGCDHPVAATENGKPEPKNEKSNISTQIKLTIREPNKDDGSEDDSDFDEDSDEDDSDGNDSDEGQIDFSGVESSDDNSDDDYDDESSDEADEETPKKVLGTKRPSQSASKTPIPEKKAKLLTPQKTGKTGPEGKKVGGHTATPHPSKKSGKTSINNDNSKQKTPKSSGQIPCKSCSKTFNSDTALQSHSKTKHSEDK